jgi:hypothetical protein
MGLAMGLASGLPALNHWAAAVAPTIPFNVGHTMCVVKKTMVNSSLAEQELNVQQILRTGKKAVRF